MVGLLTLTEWLGGGSGERCHIHFGGCDTFSKGEGNLQDLMEYSGAASVSGYATGSGWLEGNAPAVLLELQLFWYRNEVDLEQVRGRSKELRSIETRITDQSPDSNFRMLVRRYRSG